MTLGFELIGLGFFSLLMGMVDNFMKKLHMNFDVLFQNKIQELIFWTKRIENSRKGYYI